MYNVVFLNYVPFPVFIWRVFRLNNNRQKLRLPQSTQKSPVITYIYLLEKTCNIIALILVNNKHPERLNISFRVVVIIAIEYV